MANEYPSTIRDSWESNLGKIQVSRIAIFRLETLDTNVERKRKWVEIDLIDTDSERVKTAKQELLEALLEQEGLCWTGLN